MRHAPREIQFWTELLKPRELAEKAQLQEMQKELFSVVLSLKSTFFG